MCPYNATHMLDPLEYEHHLHVCPTSGNVVSSIVSLGEEREVGIISIEDACNLESDTLEDEDWNGSCPTYNPEAATANKPVVRMAIGLSKARKKQFKQQERERMASLESNANASSSQVVTTQKQLELEKPLRPPKKAAKALSCGQSGSIASVSISDLISKLKEVSVEKTTESLFEPSITLDEEKENISTKSANTSMVQGNSNTSVLNTNDISVSSPQKPTQNVSQNLPKEKETESRKVLRMNPRMAANLCGEVKKISTGRGFTLAYQHLKAEISKNQGADKSTDDFKVLYGYEENEEDVESQNKSS